MKMKRLYIWLQMALFLCTIYLYAALYYKAMDFLEAGENFSHSLYTIAEDAKAYKKAAEESLQRNEAAIKKMESNIAMKLEWLEGIKERISGIEADLELVEPVWKKRVLRELKAK